MRNGVTQMSGRSRSTLGMTTEWQRMRYRGFPALSENGMGMPDPKNDITGDRADKYISLADVIHDLEWLQSVGCHSIDLCDLKGRLKYVIPTVEKAPVQTGTWEKRVLFCMWGAMYWDPI